MRQTIQFIKDNYGVFTFDCKKYEQLYAFMTHDKKNTSGTINFTLLKDIGDIRINQIADKDTISKCWTSTVNAWESDPVRTKIKI